MKKYNREAIYNELKNYCPFAKESDFIEITKWTNGEGVDINICTNTLENRMLQVTWGEFNLIKKLIKELK